MPDQQRLTWRRAYPGLIISVALIAIALVVLFRARVGVLRGDTYRLYALANEARGVIKGTEVWLDGQKVGLVDDIRFRPPTTDTSERILLALTILENRQPLIRENSRVAIRSGGRMISSPVIFIMSGTSDAPQLEDRDTLREARQSDMEALTSEFALAVREVGPVLQDLKQLGAMLGRSRARLNDARDERGGLAIQSVGRDARLLGTRAAGGSGSLGAFLRDDSLLARRAERALARVDSVLAIVNTPDRSLSRLGSDSAVTRNLASMRNELAIIRSRMQSASGTAGRLTRDSALTWQMRRRERALADLIADIKRDPARYISF